MSAFENIKQAIEQNKSFVLEAGAGSGKTYTLIETLNYLIQTKLDTLQLRSQRIVCITYTNVAKNEITTRLENCPFILVSTIHEFLWDCIKSYQAQLKSELCILNEKRAVDKPDKYHKNLLERIENIAEVIYNDSDFRNFEKGELHHDDVIVLAKMMFDKYKTLTSITSGKYPYILVDEYQDTARETIETLVDSLLERNKQQFLIGFYGDSFQKIYDTGIGSLDQYVRNEKLIEIKKEENFRSSIAVVQLINNIRTNITQIPNRKNITQGYCAFIYFPNPPRKIVSNAKGKLIDEPIKEYENRIQPLKDVEYDKITSYLSREGWDFGENGVDKILVLTNSRIAKRGNFSSLYEMFSKRYSLGAKRQLLDRENPLLKPFVGYYDRKNSIEREIGVEHLVGYWEDAKYSQVFSFLQKVSKTSSLQLDTHKCKKNIIDKITRLIELRKSAKIKDVLDYCTSNGITQLPNKFKTYQEKVELKDRDSLSESDMKDIALYSSFLETPYKEIINLYKHTQNNTIFSTKHGTKGEEYRNVLVVIDDTDWKQEYNFNNYFSYSDIKQDRLLRTTNLFYVSCSRAIDNLYVLMLSDIQDTALSTINNWFGENNVYQSDNKKFNI